MKISISILAFLFCISCKNLQDTSMSGPQKSYIIYSKDSSETHFLLERVRNNNYELNLPQLEKGVDSFELRIWNTGNLYIGDNEQVLCIVKLTKNGFIATKTIYKSREAKPGEKTGDYLNYSNRVIDSSKNYRLSSKITPKQFLDSISTYNFDKLPFQNEIPNFFDNLTHGCSFMIEVATKDYYKLVNYNSPEFYALKKHEVNNQRVKSFIEFIQRNFSISFHWYPDWYISR